MNTGPDPALEEFFLQHKMQITQVERSAWVPLREAWRGIDMTLGNRVQMRALTIQARGLFGASPTADFTKALGDAKYVVDRVCAETVNSLQPILSYQGGFLAHQIKSDFHGMQDGMMETSVTVILFEFRGEIEQ